MLTVSTRGGAAALLTVAVALGAATACSPEEVDSESIRIGIKFDQPGLGMADGAGYTGLDVDVATRVAGHLGYSRTEIEWVQTPTAQRESLLEDGAVDMVVATYSITEERAQHVDFAGPYFLAGQDLLVQSSDDSINGPDDLAGRRLCTVAGSTSAAQIRERAPDANLREFPTYSECLVRLVSDTVDAVTTDDVILAGYAAQDRYQGRVRLVGEPFSRERYGIGLPRGDSQLCLLVNEALTDMAEDGSLQASVDRHFGDTDFTPLDENPPSLDTCV